MGNNTCGCLNSNPESDLLYAKYKTIKKDFTPFVIKIQKHFRGYLIRRIIYKNKTIKQENILFNAEFDEKCYDIFDKSLDEIFSMENLNKLMETLVNFYSDFFNYTPFQLNNRCFIVKESFFKIERREDFLNNFKIIILIYMNDNFNLGPKTNNLENISVEYEKEEDNLIPSKMIEKFEVSSINSTSFKKLTFTSNVGSVKTENFSPDSWRKKLTYNTGIGFIENPNKNDRLDFKTNVNISSDNSFLRLNSILKKAGPNPNQRKAKKSLNLVDFKTPEFNRKSILFYNKNTKPFEINNDKKHLTMINLQNKDNIALNTLPNITIPLYTEKEKMELEQILENYNKISGVKFVKIFYKKEEIYYEGYFHEKLCAKYGLGILVSINSKKVRYKYLGYFKNDKFHGYGILIKEDGYIYQGEFRNGKPSGYGIENTDKYNYKGFFMNSKFQGYGEVSYTNKTYYQGCFNHGTKENFGYSEFDDGSKYIGNYLFNKMNSCGLFEWPAGHCFFGNWKDDKMHGKGKYTWKNGDIYIGCYQNDLRHGEGEYFFAERNSVLRGTWMYGKKHGRFRLMENGESFDISYKNDVQI